MKKLALYLCLLLSYPLVLSSCDSGGNGISEVTTDVCQDVLQNSCDIPRQNQCVHQIMKDYYLWYQHVTDSIDYNAYSSPAATLEALRYYDKNQPLIKPDRFSYITTQSSFESLYADGQYLGYGFQTQVDSNARVWVDYVFEDSPAGKAGVQRGDEIYSINGQVLSAYNATRNWTELLGPQQQGYSVDMVLVKADASNVSINLSKTVVNVNTVLYSDVLDIGGVKTGYLVFQHFLSTSVAEIQQVFADFDAQGVSQVILDLRYNGGGSVDVSNTLASYLNGTSTIGNVFSRLLYNDKHQSENHNYLFKQLPNALTLDQLIVITSEQTCSASELVINGLSPYLPVKTVGSATCGKPVGMNAFYFCDNALLPITFESQNRDGQGGYFDGIAADCAAQDDVSYEFGDLADPMLSQAIYLAQNGSCQSAARPSHSAVPRTQPATGSLSDIFGAY
jgi:carboxyl-terminal processing protease